MYFSASAKRSLDFVLTATRKASGTPRPRSSPKFLRHPPPFPLPPPPPRPGRPHIHGRQRQIDLPLGDLRRLLRFCCTSKNEKSPHKHWLVAFCCMWHFQFPAAGGRVFPPFVSAGSVSDRIKMQRQCAK